ncbi:MAG TPA: ARMT1-like domain-containing protein, partial [Polyangia bacterium]|nr:ARMT1-like domain-containing protein [Polyangia bacterium]
PELLDRLAGATPPAAIHLLADNAGPELLADLLLADALLRLGDTRVVFHCKPWPMFVSDALVDDVRATVDGLRAHPAAAARAAGDRLSDALARARLRAETHVAWGEPRHFDALDADLTGALAAAGLVLAKGDLNYRRFVGDRDWPIDTPAADASAAVPFTAFALRVLKSDTLVGVTPAAAARAAALSPGWRTDGTHALVQRLGGGRG